MSACCQYYSPSSWLPYPNYLPFALPRALLEEPSLVGSSHTWSLPQLLTPLPWLDSPVMLHLQPVTLLQSFPFFNPGYFVLAFNFLRVRDYFGFFSLHLPHPFICNNFITISPGIPCCLGDMAEKDRLIVKPIVQ